MVKTETALLQLAGDREFKVAGKRGQKSACGLSAAVVIHRLHLSWLWINDRRAPVAKTTSVGKVSD